MKTMSILAVALLLVLPSGAAGLVDDKTGQPPKKGDKVEYHGSFVLSQHIYGYDTNGVAISTAISVFVNRQTQSSALFYFGFHDRDLPKAYANTSLDKFKSLRGTFEGIVTVTNSSFGSPFALSPDVYEVRMLSSIEPIL
jgi:hypothetical protein